MNGAISQVAATDGPPNAARLACWEKGRPSAAPTISPALLTDDQAAALLGVSVRKFHELRAEPWMPAAITLGPRLLRWSMVELQAAIAAMPRQQAAASEPAQLARARINSLKTRGVPA